MLEMNIVDILEGRKKAPPMALGFLRVLSYGYGAGVYLRNVGYDIGLFETKELPVPVISVGNIVAGGAGKTPFVLYLAKALMPYGKVAILSRGYRSRVEHMDKPLVVDEKVEAEECGDEPCLLSHKLPEAIVIAGKDRIRSALYALQLGAEIILLDDGMQHRRLARTKEIVVMHARSLFGGGCYLPRGFLRDSPSRLMEASLIVVSGVHDEAEFKGIQETLAEYTAAPVVGMGLSLLNGETLAGKRVGAFCAIAAPDRFFCTLKQNGCQLLATETQSDHVAFSLEFLTQFARHCRALGADCLVCTEKDRIKLPEELNLELPVQTLEIEAVPHFNSAALEILIEQMRKET